MGREYFGLLGMPDTTRKDSWAVRTVASTTTIKLVGSFHFGG